MKIGEMSEAKLATEVVRVFGKKAVWSRRSQFCFVHLDEADQQVREDRMLTFVPTLFFDPKCSCCSPFLADGAFIVYDDEGMVGLRRIGRNTFESVVLNKNDDPMRVVNKSNGMN